MDTIDSLNPNSPLLIGHTVLRGFALTSTRSWGTYPARDPKDSVGTLNDAFECPGFFHFGIVLPILRHVLTTAATTTVCPRISIEALIVVARARLSMYMIYSRASSPPPASPHSPSAAPLVSPPPLLPPPEESLPSPPPPSSSATVVVVVVVVVNVVCPTTGSVDRFCVDTS